MILSENRRPLFGIMLTISEAPSCLSPSPLSAGPNVGKSTLFNRLVGRRLALVDDQPGVTRDRREGEGRLGDLPFKVIDTAGLEEADAKAFRDECAQTAAALAQADVVLFLIDAHDGQRRSIALSPIWCAARAGPQSWSPTKARAEPAKRACSKPTRSGSASRWPSAPSMAKDWPDFTMRCTRQS